MKNLRFLLLPIIFVCSCASLKQKSSIADNDVERIIRILSSDEMQGRATFTPGINKAASFIEAEFKAIGLKPLDGSDNFRQLFYKTRIISESQKITIGNENIPDTKVMIITSLPSLSYNESSVIETLTITSDESFFDSFKSIMQSEKPVLAFVDKSHADAFKRLRDKSLTGRIVSEEDSKNSGAAIFVLGIDKAESFNIEFKNKIETLTLYNVAGVLPGKSKAKELVIFSAHYDHLGIIKTVEGDSIANGADDDASGVSAVISLAKHFKKLNINERTIIFVAFTAEEIGGFGSQHFSEKLNPDDVTAMFNIEMIGKESKFGKNSAFITGYEKSSFGSILQKNLEGTDFKFHPDPYIDQNLFYRSDNANLAALGVPAHTISTDQIDTDKFYHTAKDEFKTLDVQNILATIQAIALSARSIVAGTDTPTRISVMP